MRTTLQLAAAESRPLGAVASELMRKGIERRGRKARTRNGFVLFGVSSGAEPFATEDVKRAEEEENERFANLVAGR